MRIVTLTRDEYDDAVTFVRSALIDKRYSNYLHTIGNDDNRRVLQFKREAKADWQLVTPHMILAESGD